MAFHQLEKVLARAATNRSFRDELATGDADLDELGLSDDEQSVLTELVASSGAGLDAVLNIVTAIPASAAGMPHAPLCPPPVPHLSQHAGVAGAHPTPQQAPSPGSPATTTPAFALMTPEAMAAATQATTTPGTHHTGAPGNGPGGSGFGGFAGAGFGGVNHGHPGGQTPAHMAPAHPGAAHLPPAMPAGMPGGMSGGLPPGMPGSMAPAHLAAHIRPAVAVNPATQPQQAGAMPQPSGMASQVPGGFHYGIPASYESQPSPDATLSGSPNGTNFLAGPGTANPRRSLDAADLGRPVVARLPFGMDVVK